ncbi:MAG: hypothetical protein EA442_01680 [Candidatus Nitrosopelagicus sp.]|nr:MAG: hypothetical protein EA442_01680 [Candidatus Nitrosopelagicus sp.]
MNEKELQELVRENKLDFKIIIEGNSFRINETEVFQTDNPITEPTTRGGVYFAEMKELKVQATVLDTKISKHLSKAMLGPNKDFLDIELRGKIEDGKEICLITNLTNSMQNASKVVLYLTLKDAIIES